MMKHITYNQIIDKLEVEDGESTQAMMKQFVMLTKEDQEKYLGLYNAYDCDTSEWSTEMRSVHNSVMSGTADMTFPNISQEKATRVWEIMCTNAFHNGVYLKMSRFNHSCHSNTEHFWNIATKTRDMRALRDIKISEEITVNYRHFWMMPWEDRRTELKETFNFNCQCEACNITEQEIEKEANNCRLYWEEEKMKTNIKAIQGTYESVVKEAECLKRMYKLARVTKGLSKKNFLWKIVEELFDV